MSKLKKIITIILIISILVSIFIPFAYWFFNDHLTYMMILKKFWGAYIFIAIIKIIHIITVKKREK